MTDKEENYLNWYLGEVGTYLFSDLLSNSNYDYEWYKSTYDRISESDDKDEPTISVVSHYGVTLFDENGKLINETEMILSREVSVNTVLQYMEQFAKDTEFEEFSDFSLDGLREFVTKYLGGGFLHFKAD